MQQAFNDEMDCHGGAHVGSAVELYNALALGCRAPPSLEIVGHRNEGSPGPRPPVNSRDLRTDLVGCRIRDGHLCALCFGGQSTDKHTDDNLWVALPRSHNWLCRILWVWHLLLEPLSPRFGRSDRAHKWVSGSPPPQDLVPYGGCSFMPRGSGDVPEDGLVVGDALAAWDKGVDERRRRQHGALAQVCL